MSPVNVLRIDRKKLEITLNETPLQLTDQEKKLILAVAELGGEITLFDAAMAVAGNGVSMQNAQERFHAAKRGINSKLQARLGLEEDYGFLQATPLGYKLAPNIQIENT